MKYMRSELYIVPRVASPWPVGCYGDKQEEAIRRPWSASQEAGWSRRKLSRQGGGRRQAVLKYPLASAAVF